MKKNTGVVAVLSEQHTGVSSAHGPDLNDGIWSFWVDTVTGEALGREVNAFCM